MPFCACAIKNMQFGPQLRPNRQNSCILYEIGVEHDGDVRFLTGSKNTSVSRMHNETNMQFGPWLWPNRRNS